MIISKSIHTAANGIILFFLWLIFYKMENSNGRMCLFLDWLAYEIVQYIHLTQKEKEK